MIQHAKKGLVLLMYTKITKNGQIRIPKKVQNDLNLLEGHYLYIYESQKCIYIEKDHEDDTLNQCLFANDKVTIPMELRKLLNISNGTHLYLDVSDYNTIRLMKNDP